MSSEPKEISFTHSLLPVLFLLVFIVYGLLVRPLILEQDALALETIFIVASVFSVYGFEKRSECVTYLLRFHTI